jgi:hypothetical protein
LSAPTFKPSMRPKASASAVGQRTLHMFASQGRAGIHAVTADRAGTGLPASMQPWTYSGDVPPRRALPHGLNRAQAEVAIDKDGFVLWRMKPDATNA